MRKLKDIRWMPVLMVITIIGIAVFQGYWLKNIYQREKRTLERTSNFTFRETIHSLQASKLKLEGILPQDVKWDTGLAKNRKDFERERMSPHRKMVGMINVLRERAKDSILQRTLLFTEAGDSAPSKQGAYNRNHLLRFLYEVDSLQDKIEISEIEAAYNKRMQLQNISVPYTIKALPETSDEFKFDEVTIGLSRPVTYKLQLGDLFPYIMNRIKASIILSLFIVGFTTFSFVLLYRNLVKQRKLAIIKNDFISNITHELKTPIATVSVAIEALRSFNASLDPQRTKEYLDISHNELQRLSLLVDKVLKLSMFENKEVELKYEPLNMKDLLKEVTSSMRLQFEKHKAVVNVTVEGDTCLRADRLHLVSVIFNLIDNALKYSKAAPRIDIEAKGNSSGVVMTISDNGIGIPKEYHDKIFEKFFRVPTGNLHNAKGYGLGLSYVAHVVKKHKGTIEVKSNDVQGSKFVITLPKQQA